MTAFIPADPADRDLAVEAVHTMHRDGLSLRAIARQCTIPAGNTQIIRAILAGNAHMLSQANADRILAGIVSYRERPPVPRPPGGARTPTPQARQYEYSGKPNRGPKPPRQVDTKKQRRPKADQTPVLIPAEFHHPQPDPVPQPRLSGRLVDKLRERRRAERGAA